MVNSNLRSLSPIDLVKGSYTQQIRTVFSNLSTQVNICQDWGLKVNLVIKIEFLVDMTYSFQSLAMTISCTCTNFTQQCFRTIVREVVHFNIKIDQNTLDQVFLFHCFSLSLFGPAYAWYSSCFACIGTVKGIKILFP